MFAFVRPKSFWMCTLTVSSGTVYLSLDSYYSTEVVSKLRQKEQTQSFINKPCSLFVSDRSLIIYDRGSHVKRPHFPPASRAGNQPMRLGRGGKHSAGERRSHVRLRRWTRPAQ